MTNNNQVSVVCGIESLAAEVGRGLMLMGIEVCPHAPWRVLLDGPGGWAARSRDVFEFDRTVVVTDNPCPEYKLYLLEANPAALIGGAGLDKVVTTLARVQGGERCCPNFITTLTKSECLTLHFIAEGHALKKIAHIKGVGDGTLRNTITELYVKLNLKSHVQLALYYHGHWHILMQVHNWRPAGHLIHDTDHMTVVT